KRKKIKKKVKYMDVLDEAKELMEKAGCKKAFAVYGLELNDIAEVKDCDEKGESLELEKDISELVPTIEQKLVFDPEKPIECPLNSSMNTYLEFSLKNRSITPCNLSSEEYERIESEMSPLLEKYKWTIKK
ncbi:MAG: hypothetical protein KJ687_10615, partial [Proteobacteria bacterium]|nr:hypothetical protein [Pseudomonadota bacterium]